MARAISTNPIFSCQVSADACRPSPQSSVPRYDVAAPTRLWAAVQASRAHGLVEKAARHDDEIEDDTFRTINPTAALHLHHQGLYVPPVTATSFRQNLTLVSTQRTESRAQEAEAERRAPVLSDGSARQVRRLQVNVACLRMYRRP